MEYGRVITLEFVGNSRLPVPVGPYVELELLFVGYGAPEDSDVKILLPETEEETWETLLMGPDGV